MQFSRSPLAVQASVIVHTIRQVRVFLNLTNHHARPDRVWRAGRNKKRVTSVNSVVLKQILQCVVVKCFDKGFLGDARFQANKNLSVPLCREYVPHFRLAASPGSFFVSCSVSIVRMDLDRELVVRKKELNKDRKIARFSETHASPFGRHLLPRFAQSYTRKWASGNLAIDPSEPNLANRHFQICFFREKGPKRVHPPNALHKLRFNSKGLRLHSESRRPLPRAQKIFPVAAALPQCVRSKLRTTSASTPARRTLRPEPPQRRPGPEAFWQFPYPI